MPSVADTTSTDNNFFNNSAGSTTDNGATVNNNTGLDSNNSAGDTIAGSSGTDAFWANSATDLLNESQGDLTNGMRSRLIAV
jgi:hypothetical protein